MKKSAHVLRMRAEALAAPSETPVPERVLKLIEFTIGKDRFALETRLIDEVFPVREIAVIPGAPPFVLGIVSVRGKIVSVIDLPQLLGTDDAPNRKSAVLIILHSGAMEFAIAIDQVTQITELPESAVQTTTSHLIHLGREHLLGVTADGLVVLNAAAVIGDPRLAAPDDALPAQARKGS